MVATFFCPGQSKVFADKVEHCRARVEIQCLLLAVDGQRDFLFLNLLAGRCCGSRSSITLLERLRIDVWQYGHSTGDGGCLHEFSTGPAGTIHMLLPPKQKYGWVRCEIEGARSAQARASGCVNRNVRANAPGRKRSAWGILSKW